MKQIYCTAIGLLFLFSSCTKHNENNELNTVDLAFMQQMSLNHKSEIEAAKLITSNGNAATIKDFGQDMSTFYTNSQSELERLAATVNLDIENGLDIHSQQAVARLNVLSGYSLDTAYINAEVKTHRVMMALFQDAFNNGNNATVKGYVHRHFEEIEKNFLRADSLARHL
jgi:putative membrane protein